MTIRKILDSKKPSDIFDPLNWKTQFQSWVKHVHPDKNPDHLAKEAFEVLMRYKEILEKGHEFSDEFCPKILFKDKILTFYGPMDKLKLSHDNFLKIKDTVDPNETPFRRYLPEKMELEADCLKVYLQHDPYLIQGLTLEEKHGRWFLNRLIEFSTLLNEKGGFTHCGLNPNSVFICPEEHGIQVVSFYHLVPKNAPMKSAIGVHPYKSWYPTEIFATKISVPEIDLLMSKHLATYTLGDNTGFVNTIRGKVSVELLDFLLSYDSSLLEGYFTYQKILDRSPRVYHKLTI
tara:strand:+ start:131 stop:1000 length:870 start_codon:yes stop_codon:yes gene_type:complete